MAHLQALIFDVDGTLADTAGDIIATLNAVLGKLDLAPLPLDSAREMIGAGARVLLQRGLKASGVSVTPERLEDLFQDFLAHYEIHLADESTLFPGVELALSALKAEGHRLAVCTNKIEAHSILLLEALKIDGHFSAICGRDSFEYFKPDARHLTLTIEKSGGSSSRAVMVGDSKTDIDTARNASIPVVGVSFGYTDIPIVDGGCELACPRHLILLGLVLRHVGMLVCRLPRIAANGFDLELDLDGSGLFKRQNTLDLLAFNQWCGQPHQHEVVTAGFELGFCPCWHIQPASHRAHFHHAILHQHLMDFRGLGPFNGGLNEPVGHVGFVFNREKRPGNFRAGGRCTCPRMPDCERAKRIFVRRQGVWCEKEEAKCGKAHEK